MPKRTKYDVLNKESVAASNGLLNLVFTSLITIRKIESDKYSEEEKEIQTSKLMKRILPTMKVLAHLGYENAKDIKNIDKETLEKYLKSKRISLEDFTSNYHKKQNDLVKILTLAAVLEKAGVDVANLNNPEVVFNLLEGDNSIIDRIIDLDLIEDANLENFIDEVLDENFNYKLMSNELNEFIESYHNEYMEKVIYPKVTTIDVNEKQILKNAKSYGKK